MMRLLYACFALLFFFACAESTTEEVDAILDTWTTSFKTEEPDRMKVHATLTLRDDLYFTLERDFSPMVLENGQVYNLHYIQKEAGPFRKRGAELLLQVKEQKLIPQDDVSKTFIEEMPDYDLGQYFYNSEAYRMQIDSLTEHTMLTTDLSDGGSTFVWVREEKKEEGK